MKNNPIGIFDSGIGGLTVVRAVRRMMPNESIIYFGDTARVPYGNKSPETVQEYSLQIAEFLIKNNAKIIIVACNTATALALNVLQKNIDLPVIGVVKPGVEAALKTSNNKRIGVIGTIATITSEVYRKELENIDKKVTVTSQACPLFVPLAEEGWIKTEATKLIAEEYLEKITKAHVDTLILGCTHYPLLTDVIKEILTEKVTIVDSAHAMAINASEELRKNNLLTDRDTKGKLKLFVSDLPARFEVVSKRFLGKDISNVEKIHLDTV